MATFIVWDQAEVGIILHEGADIGTIVRNSAAHLSVYQVTDSEGAICYEGDCEAHALHAVISRNDELVG